MRGSLARDLLIFAIGLILGYFFALYNGAKLVQKIVHRVPTVSLSRPAIVLILIGVVILTLILTGRRRK